MPYVSEAKQRGIFNKNPFQPKIPSPFILTCSWYRVVLGFLPTSECLFEENWKIDAAITSTTFVFVVTYVYVFVYKQNAMYLHSSSNIFLLITF